jgi:GPH family glycoside/pentoside/hexuronide:cation symporter
MMADVADFGEFLTGRRSTALAFASIIFGLKLGLGLGAWLNGELLDYVGYSADVALPTSATRGILMMVSLVPASFLLIAAVVMLRYRLDDTMMRQIEQSLAARRDALAASAAPGAD